MVDVGLTHESVKPGDIVYMVDFVRIFTKDRRIHRTKQYGLDIYRVVLDTIEFSPLASDTDSLSCLLSGWAQPLRDNLSDDEKMLARLERIPAEQCFRTCEEAREYVIEQKASA